MMMRKILIASLLFLPLVDASAIDFGAAKEDGGRPGALFDFAASARSLGMGRTHVAIADDASASYWNAAGLSQLRRKDLVTMYSILEEDTGFGFLSFAQPTVDWGTFGIGIVNLRSSGFQKTDINGNQTGTFDQNEMGLLLSHGFNLRNKLALGSSVRVVRQKIDTRDDVGFGLDLSSIYHLHPKLKLGLSINNLIAPELQLDQEADEFPREVRAGLAYSPSKNWTLATDFNQIENRSLKIHVGAERRIKNILALRIGVNETEFTTGLGFDIGDWSLGYSFGYHNAIAGVDDLGGNHRFGFRLKIGGDIEDQIFSVRQQRIGRKLLSELAKQMDTPEDKRDAKKLNELVQRTSIVVQKGGFIRPQDLYQARGYIYYFRGDSEKAVQAFGESVDLTSGNKSQVKRLHKKTLAEMSEERTKEIVAFETGRVQEFYSNKQFKEAVTSAKRILSFQPGNSIARAYLKDARKQINEPIQRELKLAKKLYEQEEYLKAMNHLLRIKELDPKNKEAARYMSHSMAALKKKANTQFKIQNPQKRAVYEIGKNPKKSQQLYSQGLLYYSQGKLKEAVSTWDRAVRLDTTNSMARNAYNRAVQELGAKQ